MDKNTLKNTYLMTYDTYNAIMNTEIKLSFEEKAKKLNTKNRTLSLIKRIFFNIIFGIDKNIEKLSYVRILGINKNAISYLKYFKITYLLGFTISSMKNAIKNFPKNKAVKINKKGEYILSNSIKHNILASELYYTLGNYNISERRIDFLKFTK